LFARENAIRTQMNEAGAVLAAQARKEMRKKGVGFYRQRAILGVRPLLDYAHSIDHGLRPEKREKPDDRRRIEDIDAVVSIAAVENLKSPIVVERLPERYACFMTWRELPQQAVPQHAVPAQYQDAHLCPAAAS